MTAETSVLSVVVGTLAVMGAAVISSGRLFQSLGPDKANERSPTVKRRDRRTMS